MEGEVLSRDAKRKERERERRKEEEGGWGEL